LPFWYILLPYGIFIAVWYFYPILVHFCKFGLLYQEKSGNPVPERLGKNANVLEQLRYHRDLLARRGLQGFGVASKLEQLRLCSPGITR
jgi:hypothetical protein